MQRRDYDLELTRYDGRGWSATFFVTGMEHSLTNDTATAWKPTPWRAVQVAAWNALGKAPGVAQGPSRPRMSSFPDVLGAGQLTAWEVRSNAR